MKYIICITFLLLSGSLVSQVKIEWSVDQTRKKTEITISNLSNKSIVLPLNKNKLQAYFSDNQLITKDNWSSKYPFFAVTLNVYDQLNQNRIMTSSAAPYVDPETTHQNIPVQKKYDSIIGDWMLKNNIKEKLEGEINYYLVNHFTILKPKEKIMFSTGFDLLNVTDQENGVYDSYLLEKNKTYKAFLSLNIDATIYNYLTEKQQQQFKKYKFFKGKIKSNTIELIQ